MVERSGPGSRPGYSPLGFALIGLFLSLPRSLQLEFGLPSAQADAPFVNDGQRPRDAI